MTHLSYLPRHVPWISWEEWDIAKKGFYATLLADPYFEKRVEALKIVSLWRCRGGGLPHSIESTSHLAEISMLDTIASSSSVQKIDGTSTPGTILNILKTSEISLRLQYTLAIIRSVNGLVDPSQQAVFAESVMSLAQRRGIPGWIVEIRHDGTHNQLPSMAVLRDAAQFLMHWYYVNYWDVQSKHLRLLNESTRIIFVDNSVVEKADEGEHSAAEEGSYPSTLGAVSDSWPSCPATTLTEILLPMFIYAGIHAAIMTANNPAQHTANPILNRNSLQTVQTVSALLLNWKNALRDKFHANPDFFSILVSRIACLALDATEGTASPMCFPQRRGHDDTALSLSITIGTAHTATDMVLQPRDVIRACQVCLYSLFDTDWLPKDAKEDERWAAGGTYAYWNAILLRGKQLLSESTHHICTPEDRANIEQILQLLAEHDPGHNTSARTTSAGGEPRYKDAALAIKHRKISQSSETNNFENPTKWRKLSSSTEFSPWPVGLCMGRTHSEALYSLKRL
jgi:hypothetical protein